MKFPRIDKRRWLSLLVILFLGFGSIIFFKRNYHFAFDSHHLYDEATFSQWVVGWFGDWGRGPLTAAIFEGPKVPKRNFKPSSYQWHLKKSTSKAKMVDWIEDPSGLRFVVARVPNGREFLLHCWSSDSWDTFKYSITARHVGNQEFQFERRTNQVFSSVKSFSMFAWQRNQIEFTNDSPSEIIIGNQIALPGTEPIEDWTFHISTEGKRQNRDRFYGDFVIGFDSASNEWRIFDRDWHAMEGINTWINKEKLLVEPALPPGFSF